MITTIKKVRPMFNNMVVTLNKYPTDLTTNGGIIDSTRAGSVKEYQTVVAVGPMVRGIEVGDIVYVNPKRYAVMQHKPGSFTEYIDFPQSFFNFMAVLAINPSIVLSI